MREGFNFKIGKKSLIKLSLAVMFISGLIFILFYFISTGMGFAGSEIPGPKLILYDPVVSGNFWSKKVTVYHNEPKHYYNVPVSISIPENLIDVELYRYLTESLKRRTTDDPNYKVEIKDTDGNGKIDTVSWIVPELSEVSFSVEGKLGEFGMLEVTTQPKTQSTLEVSQTEIIVSFDRDLDCHKCGKHKAPPLTGVNMTISATVSEPVENVNLTDFYPNDWLVVNANGGIVSEYNSTYKKIEWNVGSVTDSVSEWYLIRSPQRTIPPTKYYFFSELADQKSDSWFIIVADPTGQLTLRPTEGDGHELDWSPSSGTDHYAMVDEETTNDDDYVSVSNKDEEDYWKVENTSASGDINFVEVWLRTKHSAGDEEFAFCIANAGGTEGCSGDYGDYADWTDDLWNLTTNPITASAWTWDNINNLEIGIKSKASGGWGGTAYCSQAWIVVNYNDTSPPTYSNNVTSVANGSAYLSTTNYGFQINWTDNVAFDTAKFWTDLNLSGGANFTASNDTEDIFYINFTDIPAGTYYYKWYGNDTSGNENATDNMSYTITRAQVNITMWLNATEGDKTLTYPSDANVTCKINISSQNTFTLLQNSTTKGSQSGQVIEYNTDLAARAYNFTCNYSQTQNYSAFMREQILTLSKGTTNSTLYLNGTRGNNTYNRTQVTNFTATVNTTYNVDIYLDSNYTGWAIQSDTDSTLENFTTLSTVGNWWNMTGYFEGDENYSSSSETWYFNVTPVYGKLEVNLSDPYYVTYTESSPKQVTQNTTFWINATITCVGDTGAVCDEVNGTARYNGTLGVDPNHTINVTEGATPLYVVEEPMEKETKGSSSGMNTESKGSIETQDIQQMDQSPEGCYICKRDMFTNTYCNPSGSRTDRIYLLPQNYWNGTDYTPIDTTIYELSPSHSAYQRGYKYGVDRGVYQAYFKSNMSENWETAMNVSNIGIVFNLQRAGYLDYSDKSYQVLQQANTKNVVFNGNELNYTEVFTGINVQYIYISSALKENVFLDQTFRDSVPDPGDFGMVSATTYFILESQVDYKDLSVFVNGTKKTCNFTSNETIEFRDAQGGIKATLPIGYAIDSAGNITNVRTRLVHYDVDGDEENEHFLLYGVPVTWLADAEYPVMIDPTDTLVLNMTHRGFYGTSGIDSSTPSIALTAFDDSELDAANQSDNYYADHSVSPNFKGFGTVAHKFVFNISYIDINDIANITYVYEGHYSNVGDSLVNNYVWHNTTSAWISDFDLGTSDTNYTKNFTSGFSTILVDGNFSVGTTASISSCNEAGGCLARVWTDCVVLEVTYGPNPPTYSKNTTSKTAAGQSCTFSLEWTDDAQLQPHGGYIFSTNNSGTWENSSFTHFTTTPQNATNVTNLNSTVGAVVQWCFYANDTTDKWNGSSCYDPFNLTITSAEPTILVNATSNTTTVTRGEYVNISATITCSMKQCNSTNATITLPFSFELASGETAKHELGDIPVGLNYTNWTVKAIHNGTGVINVTVQSANSTGEINDTDSTDGITVTEPENPKSCGYMSKDETCTIKWLINATGAVNTAYKIDVNFTTNNTNVVSNDTNNSIVKIVGGADETKPTFSGNSTNTTAAGQPCNFTINVTDDNTLDNTAGYRFSTNNTGTWKNSSFVPFTGSGTTITAWNVTTLNSTVGALVQWKFYANDTSNNWNVSTTYNITTVSTYLEVNLTNPVAESTTSLDQNSTFNINATVTCKNANCGNVYGTVRYNGSSDNPDTPINFTSGHKPFYNTSGNILQSCGSMSQDQSCQLNWTINATGDYIKGWKIGVLFNSSSSVVADNHTDNATIKILECTDSGISLAWSSIDFGILNATTANNSAPGNSNDTYNITNLGTCTLKLWIKGTDIQNTSLSYPNLILVGNLTWNNETNDVTSAYLMTKSYVIVNETFSSDIPNITTYYWLSVPRVYAGRYNGTKTLCHNTSQQSGSSDVCV